MFLMSEVPLFLMGEVALYLGAQGAGVVDGEKRPPPHGPPVPGQECGHQVCGPRQEIFSSS